MISLRHERNFIFLIVDLHCDSIVSINSIYIVSDCLGLFSIVNCSIALTSRGLELTQKYCLSPAGHLP